jgi:ABC-type transporter Mla subunit MlaD
VDEAAEQAVATALAFADAAGAHRVILLIDRGEDASALMVDAVHDGTAEVTDGDGIARITTAPAAEPTPLPEIRAIPHTAIRLDAFTGELSAPSGAIEHLADALKALAAAFGGRTVATAEFATSGEPITIAAREGEPAVLSAGDDEYQLPG